MLTVWMNKLGRFLMICLVNKFQDFSPQVSLALKPIVARVKALYKQTNRPYYYY